MIDFKELDQAPEPENDFEIAGDDYLANYLREIETPKQEQPRPNIPNENEEIEDTEPAQITGPSFSDYQLKTSSKTAFFIVQKADQLLSAGVAAYAHSSNAKEFEADQKEIEEIAEHLGVYFAENAFELPPWVMAAIPGILIIQRKFSIAGKLRQANIEKETALRESAELRKQIEQLKTEKELQNLKNEVNNLKENNQ